MRRNKKRSLDQASIRVYRNPGEASLGRWDIRRILNDWKLQRFVSLSSLQCKYHTISLITIMTFEVDRALKANYLSILQHNVAHHIMQ